MADAGAPSPSREHRARDRTRMRESAPERIARSDVVLSGHVANPIEALAHRAEEAR